MIRDDLSFKIRQRISSNTVSNVVVRIISLIDRPLRLQQGLLPRRVTQWPIDQIDDPDHDIADRIATSPLSDFERQVVSDHLELSVDESRIVANMLVRCADYAAQVVPRFIADNPGKVIKQVDGQPKP